MYFIILGFSVINNLELNLNVLQHIWHRGLDIILRIVRKVTSISILNLNLKGNKYTQIHFSNKSLFIRHMSNTGFMRKVGKGNVTVKKLVQSRGRIR